MPSARRWALSATATRSRNADSGARSGCVGADGTQRVAGPHPGECQGERHLASHHRVGDRGRQHRAMRGIRRRADGPEVKPVAHQWQQVGRRVVPGAGAVVVPDALERLAQQHESLTPRDRIGRLSHCRAGLHRSIAVATKAQRRAGQQLATFATKCGVDPGGAAQQLVRLTPAVPAGGRCGGDQLDLRRAQE